MLANPHQHRLAHAHAPKRSTDHGHDLIVLKPRKSLTTRVMSELTLAYLPINESITISTIWPSMKLRRPCLRLLRAELAWIKLTIVTTIRGVSTKSDVSYLTHCALDNPARR